MRSLRGTGRLWTRLREGRIISLIAVVAITMLTLTGTNVNKILNSIANAL